MTRNMFKMLENDHSHYLGNSNKLLVYDKSKPGKNINTTEHFIAKGSDNVNIFEGVFDGRKLVAVKRIQLQSSYTTFLEEAHILLKLSGHPNILKFYCIETNDNFWYVLPDVILCLKIHTQEYIYIATELCQRTLDQHLSLAQSGKIRIVYEMKNTLLQLSRALDFLHKKRIVHRDIKPNNIFISQNYNAKLADFGESILLLKNIDDDFVNSNKDDPCLGTVGWQAPELYTQDNCNFKIDIFSLGLVFAYTLSTGRRHLFNPICVDHSTVCNNDDFQMNINGLDSAGNNLDIYFLSYREVVNDFWALDLIKNMVGFHPNDRWTMEKVLSDVFFT